jgi:vacuolar-type H+-ATPase subunit I/STV1
MDTLRNVIELFRDLGIVVGIPTLIILLGRVYSGRIDALKGQISLLEQTQYSSALTQIQSQKVLYELEISRLESEITSLQKRLHDLEELGESDIDEKDTIRKDIKNIEDSMSILKKFHQEIDHAIKASSIQKFEAFCKDLPNPDKPRPEHIFISTTYGDSIGQMEFDSLIKSGVIYVKGDNIFLTNKGKEIWHAVHTKSPKQ